MLTGRDAQLASLAPAAEGFGHCTPLGILSVAWPFYLRHLAACQEPLTEMRTYLIFSREPRCPGKCCQVPLKQASSTPTTVQLAACVTHHQGLH